MKKLKWLCLILSCVTFCFTLLMFSPGEFLLSHQSDFWFGWSDVGVGFTVVFCIGLFITFLCGYFIFGSSLVYSAVLMALSLLAYIQGNYINPDYGLLDGTAINWSAFTVYGIIDTALWAGVMLLAVVLAIKKPKVISSIIKCVCLYLVSVQVITLTVVGVFSGNQAKTPEEGQYVLSADNMFEFSPNTNVIVFLADAFDTEFFGKLIEEKPELFEDWNGFVYYPDFAGSFSKTCASVPFIMTGVPYENDMTLDEYDKNICSNVDFFNSLISNGYDIGLYTERTNFSQASLVNTISNLQPTQALQVNDLPGLLKNYYKLSMFRYAPHIIKPQLLIDTSVFSKYKGVLENDVEIYKNNDNFAFLDYMNDQVMATNNTKKAFRFYHVTGAHYPITMDENRLHVDENTATVYQQAEGVVSYFSAFLMDLKEKGIYDDATIIFTADHGKFNEGVVFPVFAVKLPHQDGALKIDFRPLWAKDIRNIILNAVGITALGDNIADPLHSEDVYTRERRYYNYSGDQSERLPDLHLFKIENGSIPVNTGKVYKTDGTIEYEELPPTVEVGSHLSFDELIQYSAGIAADQWTCGSYAALALPINNADHDFTVAINLTHWIEYIGDVIVSTPYQVIGKYERTSSALENGFKIEFKIPKDEISEDQMLYLRLSFPSMPFQLKTSGDLRRLGLRISSIDIE